VNVVLIGGIILGVTVLFIIIIIGFRYTPKRLSKDKFTLKWKELQTYCKDKSTWKDAIVKADSLLDSALKKRKYKGKRMGERMVSAQRVFTNNDAVWFAHNLCKKVVNDPEIRIKENDVKSALVGYRQALRDVGALPNGESKET